MRRNQSKHGYFIEIGRAFQASIKGDCRKPIEPERDANWLLGMYVNSVLKSDVFIPRFEIIEIVKYL